MRKKMIVNFLIIGLLLFVSRVQCIMWHMEPGTTKCLKDEVQGHVAVIGEYGVSEVPGRKVDFVVSFFFY